MTHPKRYLSVKETADILGLDPQTIYAKIKTGEVPAMSFASRWLIPAEWVNTLSPVQRRPAQKAQRQALVDTEVKLLDIKAQLEAITRALADLRDQAKEQVAPDSTRASA